MKPVLALFKELTSVPTAPFFESSAAGKALAWARQNLRGVDIKEHRGGLVLRYRGASDAPALALAAHMDHPAFHLKSVTAEGARAALQGGLPPHLLPGAAVEAFAAKPDSNEPLATGIVAGEEKDGLYSLSWTRPPRPGVKPAFATLALTPFSVDGAWLSSRSIDDLLGCAVSLEALRQVARRKLKVNLSVLLHRAEEVGFIGALDLIAEARVSLEDSVISVETSRELPGARPGKGPVVRLGDKACLFDANLTALLDSAAARLASQGKRCQRLRLTGGTCEATAYQAFGYEAGGVAIPLVNYHNGWGADKIAPERVRLEDVDGCLALLIETARAFAAATPRGALRRRLSARHKAAVPRLK